MADASVKVENGPTDMEPDELAERKRLAAVDHHKAQLELLKDSLKRLQARGADKDKVANQRKMIAAVEAKGT